MIKNVLCYPPVYGAYTELYAGWSEQAGREEGKGAYIVPWGRTAPLRQDLNESPERKRFWEWCEKESKLYL